MKSFLSFVFIFLVLFSFGQTIVVKEYNYNDNSFSVVNSARSVNPGDTLTFEVTIVENLYDDFVFSPGGQPGAEYYRGLKIITPNNNPAIPIIDSCRGFKYSIEFLADSNIVSVYDSSLINPGASGSYRLKGEFEVNGQDHIDSITFKYVHIVIPCDIFPGSYDIKLKEINDFVGTTPLPRESFAWVYTASNYTDI